MTSVNFQKGSEWRRWDLHIHTPNTKMSNQFTGGTDEEIWDRYIEFLEASPVEAFGITDYFSCDNYFILTEKYRAKYPNSKKVFFPNIEFRFSEAINKQDTSPDVHIIFDNDNAVCPKEKLERFLSNLKTLGTDNMGASVSCLQLKTAKDFESASISIEAIESALEKTFGKAKPYLLAFPANNDGIRSTDKTSPRKVKISDTIDKLGNLFFGSPENKEWFLREDRYDVGESEPKPVVSGSDAHSFDELERLEGNVVNFEPTWIKADLTFRGLQQICFEPNARVFIGSEPPVELRKAQQATKFIAKLSIDQIPGYDERNGKWFKNVKIPLNPELIAIIGNKGSGKSAIVDIIGLLGESRQEPYFSFLSKNKKNKKFKKNGYAENFIAELKWESSTTVSKSLDKEVDNSKRESIRYLPQSYFEQLTNEFEIESFRREIEEVVFSHVALKDRMEQVTFKEMQDFKTQQSIQEISLLKAGLRKLNIEIVGLEDKSDPLFKKSLEEELKGKKLELEALDKTRPTVTKKPESETHGQKELSKKVSELTKRVELFEEDRRTTTENIAQKKNRLQKLNSLHRSLLAINSQITEKKKELKPVCEELGLNIETIITVKIQTGDIEAKSLTVKAEIEIFEKDNNQKFTNESDFNNLKSLPDLLAASAYVKNQIGALIEKLGTPQRKYQADLDKLAKWKAQRLKLIGDKDEPISGTIKYLELQISYIDNDLSEKISSAYAKRKEISKKIFSSKEQILTFYSDLKQSVETKLRSVRTDDFFVDIDATFVLSQSFSQDFLNYINKNISGSFYGNARALDLLKDLLSEVRWNNFDSIYQFFETVLKKLNHYDGVRNPIKKQVNEIKEFYDFIFSLEYFLPRYELRLGGKDLKELSPGEKGLLLLVFYLQLDKDNIPLVIDQPEDNLDNESIFTVLANCIREAKKTRQVILVTHNPNLAVGADAEQIIYVQLDKGDNYKFSYESGAIENPRINQKVVDVLEGTQPAFIKRRLKYHI